MKLQNLNEYNGIKLGDYVVGVQINYPLLLTKIDDFGNGYPIFECENNDRLILFLELYGVLYFSM